jgi:ubiquinone/menaquinone biosynthesis C-methylase UbiE
MMTDIEKINEELFCVKYETSLFAQFVHYNKLERWIPGFSDEITEDSHLKRYQYIASLAKGKKVLDIACGAGKGSLIISQHGAIEVLGADIDQDAIRYATHRCKNQNLKFITADATTFVKQNYFDLIVSFETIEHLPEISNFLKNINTSLTDDGAFYVSTPISAKHLDNKPYNVYHVQEWGFSKFQEVVSQFLKIEDVTLQLYPEKDNSRFGYLWKRIFGGNQKKHLSTIYTDMNGIEIEKLGKNIKGYQILKCRKK